MFFDKLSQKQYQLENQAVLLNTYQGVVEEVGRFGTVIRTPLGRMYVAPVPGDLPGRMRIHTKTAFGDVDTPF